MIRRLFLLSLVSFAASTSLAAAQTDALAGAFTALGAADRRAAQGQLKQAGFYAGTVDGSYGPQTRKALVNAAAFIKDNSYGKVAFNLAEQAQADRFVTDLAAGALGKYFWGEGDEAEGG